MRLSFDFDVNVFIVGAVVYGEKVVLTRNLPFWAKLIAESAIRQLIKTPCPDAIALRRILAGAVASGVLPHYLSAVNIPFAEMKLIKDNFSKCTVNFGNEQLVPNEFDIVSRLFSGYIKEGKSESSLNNLFWSPFIGQCLLPFVEREEFKYLGLELEHEWPSNLLLPAYGDRRIDLAALVTLPAIDSAMQVDGENGKCQIPVMLIEAGKKNTSWPIEHKDSSKMEASLSAVCTRFAFELQRRGKKPESARVFGLLIGGNIVRLLVAHAVAVPVLEQENVFEIQTIVTASDDWTIDVTKEPLQACQKDSCCQFVPNGPFAPSVPAAIPVVPAVVPPQLTEKIEIEDEIEDSPSHSAPRSVLGGVVKAGALARIKTILLGIMSTAKQIIDNSEQEPDDRFFLPPKPDGFIVQGRPKSSAGSTPPSMRPNIELKLLYQVQVMTTTRRDTRALTELAFHRPDLFLRINEVTEIGDGFDRVRTETLHRVLSQFVIHEAQGQSFVSVGRATKFLVDMLAALLVMNQHELCLGGHLPAYRIGLSIIDQSWKLFYYSFHDLTEEKGAADVFTLGELFFSELYPALYNHVLNSDYDPEDSLLTQKQVDTAKDAFLKLEKLMCRMREDSLSARISVREALECAHQIILDLDDGDKYYRGTNAAFLIDGLLKQSALVKTGLEIEKTPEEPFLSHSSSTETCPIEVAPEEPLVKTQIQQSHVEVQSEITNLSPQI